MATLNQMIKNAVKQKEREIKEKAKTDKKEKKLASKIGYIIIRFCKKNGFEDPEKYILDILKREAAGESNG